MHSPLIRKHWIAHWFGCGLCPLAPGTIGSLGALPVHWLLLHVGPVAHALVILALAMIGIIAAEAASKATGDEDPSAVVVDEVVGMLIAGFFARDHGWVALVIAFGLFRLLDITKPGIIDKAQRVGPPGIAILLDDVLAGFGAGFGVWLAGRYLL